MSSSMVEVGPILAKANVHRFQEQNRGPLRCASECWFQAYSYVLMVPLWMPVMLPPGGDGTRKRLITIAEKIGDALEGNRYGF